jgi:hypothetical protein
VNNDTTAPARKEWVKAAYSPNGTMVTVTLQQGNASARATVKAASTRIREGKSEARDIASRILEQLLDDDQ